MKVVLTEESLLNAGFIFDGYNHMELVSEMYAVNMDLLNKELDVVESDDSDFDFYDETNNQYICKEWCYTIKGEN